jgi:hypothetical protein
MFDKLNKEEITALKATATELGVRPEWLYSLIDFESGWNPQAKSKSGSAKGLMQWTNIGTQSKGLESYKFDTSNDIIERYPTRLAQIKHIVKDYLKAYMPFNTEYALYMVTLAPRYKNHPLHSPLSDTIQKNNKGIKTPADYINKIRKQAGLPLITRERIV